MQQFYSGVVEDRDDPLKLGRCRVRIVGLHSESKIDLPTENLPWAMPLAPINSASVSGIGISPTGPVEGTWVIVFFKDDAFQYPVMMGTLPGFNIKHKDEAEYLEKVAKINDLEPVDSEASADPEYGFKDPNAKYPLTLDEQDTNRLARRQTIDKTIVKPKLDDRIKDLKIANSEDGTWSQSPTGYNAEYPFNHVYQSESGHIVEFDDTEGAERINIQHKTGTFTEIDQNGSQVTRIVGNGYQILDNDGFVYIGGSCVVNVGGDVALKVNGNTSLECAGNVNVNASKDINVNTAASIGLESAVDLNIITKNMKIKADNISITSSKVDAKYSQLAADGKTYFNSGKAKPVEPVITWKGFAGKLKEFAVKVFEF